MIFKKYKTIKTIYSSNFTIPEYFFWLIRGLKKQSGYREESIIFDFPGNENRLFGFVFSHIGVYTDSIKVLSEEGQKKYKTHFLKPKTLSKTSDPIDFLVNRLEEESAHRVFLLPESYNNKSSLQDIIYNSKKEITFTNIVPECKIDTRIFPIFKISKKILTKKAKLFIGEGFYGFSLKRRDRTIILVVWNKDRL